MHKLSYYENILHGTESFPFAYYYVDEHHARYHMTAHWHKEWELIHIIRGHFSLVADGTRYEANEGDCFLLADGIMHAGTPEHAVYECFVFDLQTCFRDIRMVKDYLRPFYRNELTPQIFHAATAPASLIIRELIQSMHTKCPELSVLGNLCRLFSYLQENNLFSQESRSETADKRRIALLKPVLGYIEDHYSQTITLDELAKLAGMNPRYFCRFFQEMTSMTPLHYVNSYRIEQAALLLEQNAGSITETGLACGFEDTSYFIKCFKKYRGITPRQYQRRLLQNSISDTVF